MRSPRWAGAPQGGLLLRWRAHLRTAGRRRVEPKRRRSLGDPPRKASTRPARRASSDSVNVSQVSAVDDDTLMEGDPALVTAPSHGHVGVSVVL